MTKFFDSLAELDEWGLNDIIEVLVMAGTLVEGYSTYEDYKVASRSLRVKIRGFVQRDVDRGRFFGKIVMLEVENWNQHEFLDENGGWRSPVDFSATTVPKEEFIRWAVDKKIPVPQPLTELIRKDESVLSGQAGPASFEKSDSQLRSDQKARERCRAIAEMLWDLDKTIKIKEMQVRPEIQKYGYGCNFASKTIYGWIRDLAPKNQRNADDGDSD